MWTFKNNLALNNWLYAGPDLDFLKETDHFLLGTGYFHGKLVITWSMAARSNNKCNLVLYDFINI